MACKNNTCKKNHWQCENHDQFENHCQSECKCIDRNRNEEGEIHVHEYESSVKLAEDCPDRHNHRVAGVTGEAIQCGASHVHKVIDNTDFFDHHHKICDTTGPAIQIPNTNKHIHLLCGMTTEVDEHCHEYLFTTQIQAPLV